MNKEQQHSDLSYSIANTFETALSDGETNRWNELCVSSPIPDHPDYGIVVWGELSEAGEKGFSVSLRQDFNEETLGHGGELLQAFAPIDHTYEGLLCTCDKVTEFLRESFKEPVEPVHPDGPYGMYTKETMQPILDALNAGDFHLAAELTPAKLRLCGYQEFGEEYLHQQHGHGWAGQFEDTIIAPGRYPVFATNYHFSERDHLYTNHLKDFQGLLIFLAGKCVSDSIERGPDAYPYDNTVFESPYCHSVAHGILDGQSSICLLPPFRAEPIHFQYEGRDITTYHIADTSLPFYMKQNPMQVRNLGMHIRKTKGLSTNARHLYETFIREYSHSIGYSSKSISLQHLSQDPYYSPEALKELLAKNKIQLHEQDEEIYELTAAERLDLFHTGQMHNAEQDPLKWQAEYDLCRQAYKRNRSLNARIQAAKAQAAPQTGSDDHINIHNTGRE